MLRLNKIRKLIKTFIAPKRFTKEGISSVILLSAVFSPITLSGAWVPEVGSGYNKFAIANYDANELFDDKNAFVDFSGKNYSYYGEFGVAENWAVYGTLLYQDLKQIQANNVLTESSGFGDMEIGVRYQWQAKPFVLSTSLLAKLPYLYDETDSLPRGNGQNDYEFRVLIGRSLNEYGYFGVEVGYRFRDEEPSDEYRYLLEYGISVTDNFYLRTKIDGNLSAGNSDTVTNNSNLSLNSEFDLGKAEFTAGWNFGNSNNASSRWGIEVTYRKDLYGENTLKGDGIEIGLTKVF